MKEVGVFCFDGGQVQIRLAGHGDRNGSGFFQFEEADITWQEHDDSGRQYLRVELPHSELIALRDYLNANLS